MTYHTVAAFTQSLALVLFVLVFLGSVVYALWPGNRKKFEHAARIPLEIDPVSPDPRSSQTHRKTQTTGDRDGRA